MGFMIRNTERMAMTARKSDNPAFKKTIPAHPKYDDEISSDQMDIIRRLADPDGKRAEKRVLLYPSQT